tara:strand:+ start:1385 stop:1702 length:318 start_codon:yes stop_codon:yes gene_type:complete
LKNSISNKDFKQILYYSKSLPIRDLLFYYKKEHKTAISFIVSKKMGSAVIRNKFKRRCRSLFNTYQKNQLKNYQIIIKPQHRIDEQYSWDNLSLCFAEFCSKLEP